MNPAPQPDLPPGTEFQRFDALFRKVIAVHKSAIAKPQGKRGHGKKAAKKSG